MYTRASLYVTYARRVCECASLYVKYACPHDVLKQFGPSQIQRRIWLQPFFDGDGGRRQVVVDCSSSGNADKRPPERERERERERENPKSENDVLMLHHFSVAQAYVELLLSMS